jgi:mRNA-degrading endonuclease toxin of MazEF toxin-antitoxin module
VPTEPPKRGDVYWVDFNPSRGSEQAGRRPGVIVSVASFNKVMPVVAVAAITSKDKSGLATCVELAKGQPLPQRSFVLPFQITNLDKTRLERYVGRLTIDQVVDLERALRLCWGL